MEVATVERVAFVDFTVAQEKLLRSLLSGDRTLYESTGLPPTKTSYTATTSGLSDEMVEQLQRNNFKVTLGGRADQFTID